MDFWLQMAFAVAMLMDEVLTIARVIKQKQPQRVKNYAIGFHIVFILMLLWLVVAMIPVSYTHLTLPTTSRV